MSDKTINIRIVIDLPNFRNAESTTRFFRYDKNNDTVEISDYDLRQLLLSNGSNVNVEVSFGDGHETRDAVGLMDVLGDARQTLYARRESTNEPEGMARNEVTPLRYLDIVLYRNQDATDQVARYPWHFTNTKPEYGDSVVTHNGSTYYLVWLREIIG